MRKVLLTGGRGMLGRTICCVLNNFEFIPSDLPEGDITDPEGFDSLLKQTRPDAVIHCAAMTAVDQCEERGPAGEDLAWRLNAYGSAMVAAACRRNAVRMIAISTDYVFDGALERPYHEFDLPDGGRTVYGRSKWEGERQIRSLCPDHLICRVSWLYGFGGPSFVHAMRKLADGSRPELKVVSDQIGNPTSAIAVARKLGELLERPALNGTFHLTCEGEASWYDFACEIFALSGIPQKVVPCSTAEFPRKAPRPANSRLEKRMLRLAGLSPMPHWKEALAEFLPLEFPAS